MWIASYVRRHGHNVRVSRKRCTAELVSAPVSFTTTGTAATATISRRNVVYAIGTRIATGPNRSELVLTGLRALERGRYTLTLTTHRNYQTTKHKSVVTID
jgi:hypothetical protein